MKDWQVFLIAIASGFLAIIIHGFLTGTL